FLMAFVLNINPCFGYGAKCGAGNGYEEGESPPDGAAVVSGSRTIDGYILQGNRFYLGASRDVNILLGMVELQDFNGISLDELKTVTDRALNNMNRALGTYSQLVKKAEATPYNNAVNHQLKNLDYERFRMEKKMNRPVFRKLEEYLSKGDITGVFKRTLSVYIEIEALLFRVKAELEGNNLPALRDLWKLNESFAESSMFGSYVDRIFQFLANKNKGQSLPGVQNAR
ncbi:MAG: hypothetical protein GY940_28325, partial [bacterium]|nr:hypothetical protein [bacterium]